MSFSHEKLSVYQKALNSVGGINAYLNSWPKKFSFINHLDRASESIILNLVEGVRIKKSEMKFRYMDFSYGSCLECAACFDIASICELIDYKNAHKIKLGLHEISKMLIGLKKSWENPSCYEENSAFQSGNTEVVFRHETLKVYQLSLKLFQSTQTLIEKYEVNGPVSKAIDKYNTSIILNIAEGNGRFSALDQSNFWDIANSAIVKLSAYFDICVEKSVLPADYFVELKPVLLELGKMTGRKDYF